jgi:TonB family protein
MLHLKPSLYRVVAILFLSFAVASDADEAVTPNLPKLRKLAPTLYYPIQARTRNQQGPVLVEFDISSKGRVSDVSILTAEPHGAFEDYVTRSVESMRFECRVTGMRPGGAGTSFASATFFSFVRVAPICRAKRSLLLWQTTSSP